MSPVRFAVSLCGTPLLSGPVNQSMTVQPVARTSFPSGPLSVFTKQSALSLKALATVLKVKRESRSASDTLPTTARRCGPSC